TMRKRVLVEPQHRKGRSIFSVDGVAVPPRRHWQPRRRDGKSGIDLALLPGQRHPAAVTSGLTAVGVDEKRIQARLWRQVDLFEPKLFALVQKHLARQSQQ